MIIFESASNFFYSTRVNDCRLLSGFGTKALGNGALIKDVQKLPEKLLINPKTIVFLNQIHSVNIDIYKRNNQALVAIDDCDGVVSAETDVLFTVRTADCIPLIFTNKQRSVVGISHQGWRGSLKRMAQKMVSKIKKLGEDGNELLVATGPAIGQCCYQIDDDRYYQFIEEFDGYSPKVFSQRAGKYYLNLLLLNYLQLVEAGVNPRNIDFFPFCTACDKQRFFSFRRDKKKDYGEMISFIMMISH